MHLFILPTPIGFDDDMVTKLGEKVKHKKRSKKTKQKHNVLTKNDTIVQEKLMRESASADVIFVAS